MKPWWLSRALFEQILPGSRAGHSGPIRARGSITHVIILDGTLSTLAPGEETNAGLAYRLLSEMGSSVSLFYESGVQWQDWRATTDVLMGRGINRQIRRAYGYLASRYRPGDKIFMLGYSRGAYAVRSLAGVIDQIGLLKGDHATERNIMQAYRHYQGAPGSKCAQAFSRRFCHSYAPIEMVGVWDTVKALGIRLPLLWRWSEHQHAFHNHQLGKSVHKGFHALALNETRRVFEPVLWLCPPELEGKVEQVWFKGTHGDVGGHVGRHNESRPLSNIPLVWMLDKAEECGMALPDSWRVRFPCDATAPSVGTWRAWGKLFVLRGARQVCADPSESLHVTARGHTHAGGLVARLRSALFSPYKSMMRWGFGTPGQ